MENLGVEIRKQVVRYLANEIPVAVLQSSLAPLTWNIDQRTDPETAAIGHQLDLLLAEFSHGDWTEPELKEHLAPLVTSYAITTGDSAWTSTSSFQIVTVPLASSD